MKMIGYVKVVSRLIKWIRGINLVAFALDVI